MKFVKLILRMMLTGSVLLCQAQEQRYRIYGNVVDKQTSRGLKNISIRVLPFDKELNTDKQGRFLFNMPQGNYRFEIEQYPYFRQDTFIALTSDTLLTFYMVAPKWSYLMDEVEVLPLRDAASENLSIQHLNKLQMRRLPDMLGEKDPLKVLALGSGVNTGSEGSTDLQVRGGSGGQNLYLMDGVPLYSSSHLFGMVSAYNSIAVERAALYKADFPARFGGMTSSVVDVETRLPDLENSRAELEIGLLSSKAKWEIPVVKRKLALSVAGRYSNYSLLNLLTRAADTRFKVFFADLNTRLLWKISEKDSLVWTGFWSGEEMNTLQAEGQNNLYAWMENKQYNTSLWWSRGFSDRSNHEMQLYIDGFTFRYGNASDSPLSGYHSMGTNSSIHSFAWKEDFDYRFDSVFSLSAGASMVHYRFSPIETIHADTLQSFSRKAIPIPFLEASVHAEGHYTSSGHDIRLGLRLNEVWENPHHHFSWEPRIAYRYSWKRNVLSASLSKTTQAIHRMTPSGIGFPFEFRLPSGELPPEESWFLHLGGGKRVDWQGGGLNFHSEIWYKKMNHLLEWKDGYDVKSVLLSQEKHISLHEYLCQGEAYAHGWDLSLSSVWRKWQLTAGYTLMQVCQRFEELNYGRFFDAPTDIRNSLSLALSWQCTSSLSLSAAWQYHSGRPLNLPSAYFSVPDHSPLSYQNTFAPIYTERNQFRGKDFHKLDISMNHRFLFAHRFPSTFSLGIYNVYNRSNAFMYYISEEKTDSGGKQPVLKMVSVFPVLPSATWSVAF